MALTPQFKDAVDAGEVNEVRSMIIDALRNDPTWVEYLEKADCAQQMEGFFDDDDGEEVAADSSQWDEDYMNDLFAGLESNFSKERLELLIKVIQHVRPKEHGVRELPKRKKASGRDIMFIGLMVAVAGFYVSQTSLMIAGVVVAVGGVAAFFIDQYRKDPQ